VPLGQLAPPQRQNFIYPAAVFKWQYYKGACQFRGPQPLPEKIAQGEALWCCQCHLDRKRASNGRRFVLSQRCNSIKEIPESVTWAWW